MSVVVGREKEFTDVNRARFGAFIWLLVILLIAGLSWVWRGYNFFSVSLFFLSIFPIIYMFRVGRLYRLAKMTCPKAANGMVAVENGILGEYEVDGDVLYGMYVTINGRNVFVDIKKDRLLDKRKEFAKHIYDNSEGLGRGFIEFVSRGNYSNDLGGICIGTIGLYDSDPQVGEVYLLVNEKDDGVFCFLMGDSFRETLKKPPLM